MIPNADAVIFVIVLCILAPFTLWLVRYRRNFLLPKIYLVISVCYTIWVVALLVMKFTPPDDGRTLYALDALTNFSASVIPVLCLVISLAFIKGWDKVPRRYCWIFAGPVFTNIMVWTNPLHHLYYTNFSVFRGEVTFGPCFYISGTYTYVCMVLSIVLVLWFIINTPTRLYVQQGIMYILGMVIPLSVSLVATLGIADMSIAATPLSFVAALVFHGVAIYQLHLLDIQPLATQHMLDGISDCYLVLSDDGLVLSMNQPFRAVFGKQYGIVENTYLTSSVRESDRSAKTPVYHLLTAVETCRSNYSSVSYEQAVTLNTGENTKRSYYIAEVTPLSVDDRVRGYVCIFKDITALKNSMQELETSRNRMVEQERLAFLGQMVGGLAHNLKTPIMSISGCVSALENLVEEERRSLGDPEVTEEDYREICGEMDAWIARVRDSCAYMSDIITAIKGQAAHASASEESTFTVDELIKRVSLLMRHELNASRCQLVSETEVQTDIILHGDVNNLIQVLNNLLSNAIYAQRQTGGGQITLGVKKDAEFLKIYVRDTGPGVEPRVRSRLFKEMITSKGTQGTGLGLYISNAAVRGKFEGTMWMEDNPGGGSIFGMSIPLKNVTFAPAAAAGKEEDAQ